MSDVNECRSFVKPPAGVDDVFAATAVLLAGYWDAIPLDEVRAIHPDM